MVAPLNVRPFALAWTVKQGHDLKQFFFKKKNQKTLRGCRGANGDSLAKVFASFFKKKRFLAS
jgi:hypothetical protein